MTKPDETQTEHDAECKRAAERLKAFYARNPHLLELYRDSTISTFSIITESEEDE